MHLDFCTAHLDSQKECIHWIQRHPDFVPKIFMFFCLRRYPRYNLWLPDLMMVETYHSKDFVWQTPVGGWDLQVPSPQVQGGNGQVMRSSSHHPVRARCNLDHLTSPVQKLHLHLPQHLWIWLKKIPQILDIYINVLFDRNRYFWQIELYFFPLIYYSLRWFRCYARLNQRRPRPCHCSNVRRASQRLSLHWHGSVVQWWLGRKDQRDRTTTPM